MSDQIDISVIIICFNHSAFIGKAIRSVLKQKTAAKVEVIVHDDASVDESQNIIRALELEFPGRLITILQSENQWSKGINVTFEVAMKKASGKYVAVLDGDDYWASSSKLQKQYEALEKHPNIDLSFHAVDTLVDGEVVPSIYNYGLEEVIYSCKSMIKNGGSFARTASLMFRASAVNENFSIFLKNAPVGDRALQIFLSQRGGAVFVPIVKSVYRVSTVGSWTKEHYEKSGFNHRLEMTKFYAQLNEINKSFSLASFNIMMKENLKYSFKLICKLKLTQCLIFWWKIFAIYTRKSGSSGKPEKLTNRN